MRATEEITRKMESAGQGAGAVAAFLANYRRLVDGETGLLPESLIEPVTDLPALEELDAPEDPAALLGRTVVIKLNGGLGTGMGLDRAKSLLPVKDGLTFLDLIARQILHLRESLAPGLRFLLMNSFSTSADTREFLRKYPDLGAPASLEFLQSMAPKLDAETLRPVTHPALPDLAWCPPGHGDLYPAIESSGFLDSLLADGVEFAFVSNSDNLGATPDPRIPRLMDERGLSFVMEVTRRTASDSKGGHIARLRASGRFVLRESAQCPDEDGGRFADIERHRFFNTNNLWIRLPRLKEMLSEEGGALPLPFISNTKTVDPRDPESPPVIQLETAMGAAIGLFPEALPVAVPRARFAPVKKTSDLLVVRSDAMVRGTDWTLALAADRRGVPPAVRLSKHYKSVDALDRLIPDPPSLIRADALDLDGEITLAPDVTIEGTVRVRSERPATLPAGRYADREIVLG